MCDDLTRMCPSLAAHLTSHAQVCLVLSFIDTATARFAGRQLVKKEAEALANNMRIGDILHSSVVDLEFPSLMGHRRGDMHVIATCHRCCYGDTLSSQLHACDEDSFHQPRSQLSRMPYRVD